MDFVQANLVFFSFTLPTNLASSSESRRNIVEGHTPILQDVTFKILPYYKRFNPQIH